MTASYRVRYLQVVQSTDAALSDALAVLIARMIAVIQRYASADGSIPLQNWTPLRNELGLLVMVFILGRSGGQHPTPYRVHAGVIMPQSDYFRILWSALSELTALAVQQQSQTLTKAVGDDAAFRRQLLTASEKPALDGYDAPTERVLDGKRLLDRLWALAGELRRRLDLLVMALLSESKSATEIGSAISTYLTPGQALARNDKRFGTTGSFDLLRLARGEQQLQFYAASRVLAALTPFTTQYSVVLSPSHRVVDICDEVAANSPYDVSDTEHLPGLHSGCLCNAVWEVVINDMVIASYRQDPRSGQLNALSGQRMADYLLSE
jgi:hypothetical protein